MWKKKGFIFLNKIFKEKQNPKFYVKTTPPPPAPNRAVNDAMWINIYVRAGQAADDSMTHAHGMVES